jgi:PAS domain S-box-containing protein
MHTMHTMHAMHTMQEDAVAVINAEGIVLTLTPEFCNMFGYTKREFEGANISMIMPQP